MIPLDIRKHVGDQAYGSVTVDLTVRITIDVPVDSTDDQVVFFVEDIHCHDNYFESIADAVCADSTVCTTCMSSVAKVVRE